MLKTSYCLNKKWRHIDQLPMCLHLSFQLDNLLIQHFHLQFLFQHHIRISEVDVDGFCVLYHALRRLPAAAAVHAGGNAGAEGRNFNDVTLKMPPQHVDQIGGISVWAGRSVDDNRPLPHHILPSAESNCIRTKSNTCGNNSSLFSSVI